MITNTSQQGGWGVSRSTGPYILVQVTDSLDPLMQSRAVLTIEQAQHMVEELQEQIADVEKNPQFVYQAREARDATTD